MIYAAYTTPEGVKKQGLFWGHSEFIKETFSPGTKTEYVTDFRAISKDAARQIAQSVHELDALTVNGGGNCLTWGEYADIAAQLKKLAHRFGLVREFRENGII